MKKLIITALVAFITVAAIITSCKPDPMIGPRQTIAFSIPEGWPVPFYDFDNNPVSEARFELGRKLFFDPRLSRDNSISCGSCHQPFSAFSQLDHDFSHGVDNLLGNRNSPALFNLAWNTSFFWDGGVNHIESQPIAPIQNPVEMDENLENILIKLNQDADYKNRFTAAFGNDSINSQRIFKAIAQFMGLLISSDSKYDKYVRGESGGALSASEAKGLNIFEQKCASCHKAPLFSDFSFRNNGLAPTSVNDSGRAHITKDAADLYKFKVPSLRNLKYTPPYMHDGRFKTLNAVLDHYATGIHTGATLDPLLVDGIQLSEQDRQDLVNFLNTLNDETFVKNPRFQEFK